MSKVLRLSDTGGEIPKGYKVHDGDILVPSNTNVVWTPNPGSQTLALNCPSDEILYSSGRGVGKSLAQLARFRKTVGLGYKSHWNGVIIDRGYKNLDNLIMESKRMFGAFDDGAKFYSSKGDLKWVWKSGEMLMFRSVETEDDYQNLHGFSVSYIGINELTSYRDLKIYDLLLSINRSGFVPEDHPLPDGTILPPIPMCVFSTTNPSGISGLAVKKRFVDIGKPGQIIKKQTEIIDQITKEKKIITRTICHIQGHYTENPKLDQSYIASLANIQDARLRACWVDGNWDAVADEAGMFANVWDFNTHSIEPFTIPKEWTIDRTCDWGQSSPSAVIYFAESNGEDIVLKNGKTKSTVKGDLFIFTSIYTCMEDRPDKGTDILPQELAKLIIQHELQLGIYDRVKDGVCDTAMFSQINGNSVCGLMSKPVTVGNQVYKGVTWRRFEGLKKAGTRVDGITLFKERLYNSITTTEKPYRDRPGIFVFNNDDNRALLEVVPYMMRDKKNPDDVDGYNDHHLDTIRYKLLSLNTGMRTGKTIGLT